MLSPSSSYAPHYYYYTDFQSGDDVDPEHVLVMSGMAELAQYVYQDYHIRIDALRAKVRLAILVAIVTVV